MYRCKCVRSIYTSATSAAAASNKFESSFAFESATRNKPLKHVLTMASLKQEEVNSILKCAAEMKTHPEKFRHSLAGESLLMLFAKPSLRTRLSFEVGMFQLGGQAVYYPIDSHATLGKKESIEDVGRTISRYCHIAMARLPTRKEVWGLAKAANIPVINALDDWGHPCQVLADFQTIKESFGQLRGLKLAFLGDLKNNMTYDLMRGCAIMGMHVAVAGPCQNPKFAPEEEVVREAESLAKASGGSVKVTQDAKEAVSGAHIIYTDSHMSYGVPAEEEEERKKAFHSFQVTQDLMNQAHLGVKFMHCLPAKRDAEVTAEVIDGSASVVFNQAENRLHAQKALMLYLRGKLHD